jgi:hypothetical protein
MSDNVPVTRADYDALSARVNWLENMLRDYLLRERETAILTFNHVETALKLPRTKESRHK